MKIGKSVNKGVSTSAAAVIVFCACAIAGTLEIHALNAKDARDLAPVKQDAQECLRCHSDQKTIAKMRMKEDGANYLFKSDGTFKDSKLSGQTGDFHHPTGPQQASKSLVAHDPHRLKSRYTDFRILGITGACLGIWLILSSAGCHHPAAPPVSTAIPHAEDPIRFVRVQDLGYTWPQPSHHPENILDSIGYGCAFLDYNQDGNLDILLIGPRLALFKGDGKGHFTDVTAEAGLSGFSGHFLGCAVGDYDNDGYPDVYITGYGAGLLLHNVGGKRFEDATNASGIPSQPWGTSAAFADIDGDGKLDLFVGNYINFGPSSPQYCTTNGVQTSCPPGRYPGAKGRLYRNLGGGRFEDVSNHWGLSETSGKTLGAVFADIDGAGSPSLALANDEVPGELYRSMNGRFQNIGPSAGTAYSSVGQPHAGMGEDWGDFDNDGKLDLTVMTFSTELKPIFHNDGGRLFTDYSSRLGLTDVLLPYVAFGVKWIDADNSGWLDLLITNGHTSDNISDTGQGLVFKEPTVFLRNEAGRHFVRVPMPVLDEPIVGRGLAIGDFDNDGKVDALLVDAEGKPVILHNETQNAGHWMMFRLIGHKSNRDGYGALITVETASRKLLRHCHADGSYLSSSDPRVHFGLGRETSAHKVLIIWPSGLHQILTDVAADRIVTVEEPH